MIGPQLYDHTALVLNKIRDDLRIRFPLRRTDILNHCQEFVDGKAIIQYNEKQPLGDPRPIVELIWEKDPKKFLLARELADGMELRNTRVGKVYQKLLEKEIKGFNGARARLRELKQELNNWKNCRDTSHSLQ